MAKTKKKKKKKIMGRPVIFEGGTKMVSIRIPNTLIEYFNKKGILKGPFIVEAMQRKMDKDLAVK